MVKNMLDAICKIIPDNSVAEHIADNKFSSTRDGEKIYYLVYVSYKAYKKHMEGINHKLIRSNSFYIAKLS